MKPTKPTEYLSNLTTSALPEKAAQYLKDEILTDASIATLSEDDKDFVEITKIVEQKYPAALITEPVIEEPKVEAPKILKHVRLQNNINAFNSLLAISSPEDKKKIKGYIAGFKSLLSITPKDEYVDGGKVEDETVGYIVIYNSVGGMRERLYGDKQKSEADEFAKTVGGTADKVELKKSEFKSAEAFEKFKTEGVKYEDGGEVESVDLFEHYDELPENVKAVLDKYAEEDETYSNCEAMLSELKPLGYTFEYYLDASPYNLRKIEEAEHKKTGAIKNQYEGLSPEYIWNHSEVWQRNHFIDDHASKLFNQETQLNEVDRTLLSLKEYKDLPESFKIVFDEHISSGQYGLGGGIEQDKNFISNILRNNIGRRAIVKSSEGQKWADGKLEVYEEGYHVDQVAFDADKIKEIIPPLVGGIECSIITLKSTKDTMSKGGAVPHALKVTHEGKSKFWHVRFKHPSKFTKFATPEWAEKVSESMHKGSKVTMGKTKDGKWTFQRVLIPDSVSEDEAKKLGEEIACKLSYQCRKHQS